MPACPAAASTASTGGRLCRVPQWWCTTGADGTGTGMHPCVSDSQLEAHVVVLLGASCLVTVPAAKSDKSNGLRPALRHCVVYEVAMGKGGRAGRQQQQQQQQQQQSTCACGTSRRERQRPQPTLVCQRSGALQPPAYTPSPLHAAACAHLSWVAHWQCWDGSRAARLELPTACRQSCQPRPQACRFAAAG